MAHINGKLTKKLIKYLGAGWHGDGNGLHLVVDPSRARRWIVRVTFKGRRIKNVHHCSQKWSRKLGPVVKMDRLMKRTIRNDEEKTIFE